MLWPMQAHDFDWIVPDWPAPASVQACCSTRLGGYSSGRYGGFNLGLHVGDDPQHVQSNRSRLQSHVGARAVFMDQVHGTDMLELEPLMPDGLAADGAFTDRTGLACTVMVADCLPVLFCDVQGRQVAAAHAGWRGLLGIQGRGVLETAAATFAGGGDSRVPGELMAWLGPCIGPKAFEVGEAVRAAFVADSRHAADCFRPAAPGKWWADLQALARLRLTALGIAHIYGNDGSDAWCTVSNPSRFFSYRRDGITGRMAACIWRLA